MILHGSASCRIDSMSCSQESEEMKKTIKKRKEPSRNIRRTAEVDRSKFLLSQQFDVFKDLLYILLHDYSLETLLHLYVFFLAAG